jgi:hypothetical protein
MGLMSKSLTVLITQLSKNQPTENQVKPAIETLLEKFETQESGGIYTAEGMSIYQFLMHFLEENNLDGQAEIILKNDSDLQKLKARTQEKMEELLPFIAKISKRKANLEVDGEYYNLNCRNAEDSQCNSLLIITNMIDQVIEKQLGLLISAK